MDNLNAYLIVRQLFKRLLNGFNTTLYVSLDNYRQLLHITLVNLAEEVIKRYLYNLIELGFLHFLSALLGNGSCKLFVIYNNKVVAACRSFAKSQKLNRR